MKVFSLYILTPEGNVRKLYALYCPNEAEAMELAEALAETDSVEVWEPPVRLARFEPRILN